MAQMIRVTPVVGLPQFSGWSHVLEHTLDPQTKLVLCFSVSGENAGNVGRDVVETIMQLPPRSAQGLYESLEESVRLAAEQRCELAVAAGVFRYSRSILAVYNGTVLLKRGPKVGRLLQADTEILVVEGKYQLDDVFVLATEQAKQFLSQIELSFQRGFDSDGVITAIVPALHSLDDSASSALAFLAVTDEEPEIETAPLTQLDIDLQPVTAVSDDVPLVSIEVEATSVTKAAVGEDFPEITQQAVITTKKPNLLSQLRPAFIKLEKKITTDGVKLLAALQHLPRAFSRKTYVDGPSSKKILRWILVVIILVVIAGIIIFFWQRQVQRTTAAAQEAAQPFRQHLTELQSLATADPITARDSMTTLIETVKAAQTEATANGEKKTAQELGSVLTEAQLIYQEISGRDEVSELPIFYDLRLVSSDFISSKSSISQNTAVFVDAEKRIAIVLDVTTKQVFQLGLESIGTVKSLAPSSDTAALVLANGLYTLPLSEGSTTTEVKAEGDSNRAAILTGSFGSFVYVFNPEKRNIYRYATQDGTLSDPIGWLQDPLGVPFESVVSWAIDGDIWIGTQGGQLLRFASGKRSEFSPIGLPEVFESSLYITTREELPNIYILEPEKNRLVVLTKEGEFLREIKSSSLGAATSLLVNQTGDKAYIISGSTVFEVEV